MPRASELITQSYMNGAANQGQLPLPFENRFAEVDAQLADMSYNIKSFGALGNGTDVTAAVQAAINFSILNGIVIYVPSGDYIISDELIFSYGSTTEYEIGKGFKFIGQDVSNTRFLVKLTGNKAAMRFENINNNTGNPGIEVGGFTIMPFSDSYKEQFQGIVLQNSVNNIFKNIRVMNAAEGLYLTTDADTSVSPYNVGYTEQNVFEDIILDNCVNGVTFKPGDNDNWNTSYHGNMFNRVTIATNSTVSKDAVSINILGGLIYNCRFDIKIFFSGPRSYFFHLNGDSGTNFGDISYEVFGANNPKIRTGNNAVCKFFLDGFIYGLGSIDWNEYKTVQIGEIDYNTGLPVDSGSLILGRDKFYSLNVIPKKTPKDVSTIKSIIVKPVLNDINDLYGGITHGLARYQNLSGAQENGFMMACKQISGAGSRFIIGTIPDTKNGWEEFVPGWEFNAIGNWFRSKLMGTQLNFESDKLRRADRIMYDTGTVKTTLAASGNIQLPYHTGNTTLGYYVDKWGSVTVSTAGDNIFTVDVTGSFLNLYDVTPTFVSDSTTVGNNIVYVGQISANSFKIYARTEHTGKITWHAHGIVVTS